MTIIFANNAVTTLAVPLLAGQTTLQVLATTGELFPVPGVGEYFKLTLEDRRNRTIEITHCTGRTGDVLTIVRAQENTTALNFAIGSTVANRFTRDSAAAIIAQVTPANPWYLGPFTVAPVVDNEGNPLIAGMQYFNTTDNIFYVWTGASWVDQNNGTNAITSLSGTYMLQDPSAGFNGVLTDFNLRYIDYAAAVQTPDVTIAEQFLVFLDGVRLKPGDDYTIPVLGTIAFADPPTVDQSFTGLWVAVVEAIISIVPENAQTGITYTLALSDAGKIVSLLNAGGIILTIPLDVDVAFPINTGIHLLQLGTGQVTVAGAGVTILSSGGKLKLTGQYSDATLWKKAIDTWVLVGDIAL